MVLCIYFFCRSCMLNKRLKCMVGIRTVKITLFFYFCKFDYLSQVTTQRYKNLRLYMIITKYFSLNVFSNVKYDLSLQCSIIDVSYLKVFFGGNHISSCLRPLKKWHFRVISMLFSGFVK